MADDAQGSRPAPEIELDRPAGRGVGYLGPALAWAVVFADLGTSVYYVPAILYAQVGGLAPVFVLVAAVAFVFVALGHLEIARRYPKGGGGVAAASEAFGPRVGVISGALMVSAYLLTIAITVVTALHYISVIRPFAYEIPVLSVVALLLLGTLHWVGVRELPRVALSMAIVALACEAALVWAVLAQVPTLHWPVFWTSFKDMAGQGWTETATGFAAAWLAFSGLESLGQLAPALREPRRRVLRIVAVLVVVSLVVTVPMFTVIAVEAAQASGIGPHPALLAAVAQAYGGRALLIAVSLSGAGFLLVGANVAFIGCYNVFKAVGELGYLPAALAARHKRYGTPRVAIIVITVATVLLVITTGASCSGWARCSRSACSARTRSRRSAWRSIAWREKRRGRAADHRRAVEPGAADPVGDQPGSPSRCRRCTASPSPGCSWRSRSSRTGAGSGRGASVTCARRRPSGRRRPGRPPTRSSRWKRRSRCGARTRRRRWWRCAGPTRTCAARRPGARAGRATRRSTSSSSTRSRGCSSRRAPGPSDDALEVLDAAVKDITAEKMEAVPIWRLAHNPGASIAEAAEELGVRCVLMGTTARSAVWSFLRGDVLKELLSELPEQVHVVICE